jgi:RNA polymerase nonessential primary-like sigma factor
MFEIPKNTGQINLEHFQENPLKHTGLVCKIAKNYQYRGFDLDDLVLYGIVGLLKACTYFKKELGVRFGYYATGWIRAEIKRAIRNECHLIRIPEYLYGRINKADDKKAKLDGENVDESEYMEAARKIWKASFFRVTPGVTEHGVSWSESSIPDYYEQNLLQAYEEDCEDLRKELTKLKTQEQRVLIMIYFQGMPITKVSKITGLERIDVRRLRDRALQKLRERMQAVGA